ncbi:MAG TPA: TRAP transporter small permease [Chromatiales bacterium]|nr:TRAP transporter small permease [Chromatiales bacterium]
MMTLRSWLKRLHRGLLQVEGGILVLLLIITILIAVSQILLRNLFHSGIPWGDSLVRILVLWLALVGAMLASRNHHHIKIDILSRLLDPGKRAVLRRITDLFTASVCGILAWTSLQFVLIEYEDGLMAFNQVPVWLTEAIIPFAFAVITVRYLVSALLGADRQSS